jgi:hypothetical protein
VERSGGEKGFSDTNYIFLSFVTKYLPAGIVGLVIAVIFAATMSASSGEINSLATVTVVDIYRRTFGRRASDHHYLTASRWPRCSGAFMRWRSPGWGKRLGSLIVAVNVVGSLFYGSLLGCFVLAFGFQASAAARPRSWACWRAKPPSSGRSSSRQHFVAVVQRDRLPWWWWEIRHVGGPVVRCLLENDRALLHFFSPAFFSISLGSRPRPSPG